MICFISDPIKNLYDNNSRCKCGVFTLSPSFQSSLWIALLFIYYSCPLCLSFLFSSWFICSLHENRIQKFHKSYQWIYFLWNREEVVPSRACVHGKRASDKIWCETIIHCVCVGESESNSEQLKKNWFSFSEVKINSMNKRTCKQTNREKKKKQQRLLFSFRTKTIFYCSYYIVNKTRSAAAAALWNALMLAESCTHSRYSFDLMRCEERIYQRKS